MSGTVTVVGDLNLPSVDWNVYTCDSNGVENVVLDCFLRNNLTQFVETPTRGENILDLVLCNDFECIRDISVGSQFMNTDHRMVDFSLVFDKPIQLYGSHEFRDYKNADFVGMGDFLRSINWDVEFSSCVSVDEFYTVFCNAIEACVAVYVPLKRRKAISNKQLPKRLRKLRNRKNLLWKNMQNNVALRGNYLAAKREYNTALNEFIEQKERKYIENGDVNKFYKYANSKLKDKSRVAVLKKDDDTVVVDDIEKSEMLNEYFSSVFTVDNNVTPDFAKRGENRTENLSKISFTPTKVCTALRNLPNKLSGSPDGIIAYLLKNIVNESRKRGCHDCTCICDPLCTIFNVSFDQGKVPDVWLIANVEPRFKKGLASAVKNYRPVSLTCICCKVMERIIKDEMTQYLHRNNLISACQHGFLSKRSVTSQLLGCLNDWKSTGKDKKSIDVVYLDYSKAFDSVGHRKLLKKLEGYGITGNLLEWIKSFLSGRMQRVTVNSSFSSFVNVRSGVPQGSVLGPLLFLLFINDVVEILEPTGVSVKLFADDLKLYVEVSNDVSVASPMINALRILEDWSNVWQLQLASAKCAVLPLGYANPKRVYELQGQQLEIVKHFRDLGVIISSDLSMSSHCSKISAQAMSRSGMIFRAFS